MNDSGIIAQYGFLYQRKAFMLYVMRYVGTRQLFTFEGKDDIEIASDDKIYIIQCTNDYCVQAKSGHVTEECFSRILCNWLLLDTSSAVAFELALENDLSFDYMSQERAMAIYEFIIKGKDRKTTAVARKVYDKYKDQLENVLEQIKSILSSFKKTVLSMEEVDQVLAQIFNENYCHDITDYEIAKSKRLERLLLYINSEIDNSIKNKKPYTLMYSNFIRLVMQVTEEISDKKYTADVPYLKNKFRKDAQRIVKERTAREVRQLYLVDKKEDFIINGIVFELLYKDFRSTYEQRKAIELLNLEHAAKENYEDAKFSLSEDENKPRNVFIRTTDKQIESELLPSGSIYRKGCYIYLTSDNIQDDIQITWGEDDTE